MTARQCARFGLWKWPLAASILAWPWLIGWWAEGYLKQAESIAAALGQERARLVQHQALPPATDAEKPLDFIVSEETLADEPAAGQPVHSPRAAGQKGKQRHKRTRFKQRHGIRVREASILRLAKARAIPASTPVVAKWPRPRGLMLHGVSALGVGMRDGDVITSVAGAAVSSKSEIVTQVLHARARKAKTVSATFWRGSEPWSLVVEMPYPKVRRAQAAARPVETTQRQVAD